MDGPFDALILGADVLDGSGGAARRADVGIRGDRIAAVEADLSGAAEGVRAGGGEVVDGRGLTVCPGFIDAHSHSDAYLLLEPSAASKAMQGVTTEITGNCGASAAPRLPGYEMPSDWAAQKYPREWGGVADYRAALEEARPAVNSRMLVGHRTVRASVMGNEARAASADEVRAMAWVMERAMEEGGAGLSTGLVYAPAMFAKREELVALARVAARKGGLYATHMRSEGAGLLEAIEEALAIGRESGAPVEISHLKTAGKRNWGKVGAALEAIEAARAAGQDATADRYPYCASCTDLDVVLPEWAEQGGREAILARLRDPSSRARIRDEVAAARGADGDYWAGVKIGFTRHAGWAGRGICELAEAWGLAPVDAMLRLIDEDGLGTMGIFFGMSEENRREIWERPWVMGGSDASIRAPWGPLGEDFPHPRAYGTFGKIWREAREGWSAVGVAEAVRKCTSLPAAKFGLKGRGVVAKGAFADLLLVDAASFRDEAAYGEPHRFCTGLKGSWVNGVRTVRDGALTGARAGRYLE
ncbi:MAG: D-aminoacylase [Kiritimatiellae bacterium]|nr:D-aminoacylase [Kiritimatiellia bacterium]